MMDAVAEVERALEVAQEAACRLRQRLDDEPPYGVVLAARDAGEHLRDTLARAGQHLAAIRGLVRAWDSDAPPTQH